MAALSLRLLALPTKLKLSRKFGKFYSSCSNKKMEATTTILPKIPPKLQEVEDVPEGTRFKYPEARRDENVVDDYFGTKVKDPYRWLEDPDSSETKEFVDKQNLISKKYIDSCPYKSAIFQSIEKMWDYPEYSCPIKHGKYYFFFMNTGLQNQSVLYIQESINSEYSVFLDPNALSEDGTVSLSTSKFSEDGSIYAYGLSSSGSDWLTIHFKDVESKKDYPEVLKRVKFTTISWTHDNKGIFYGMYPNNSKSDNESLDTESDEYHKLYYHRVGTPQSEDILVFEFPDEPKFRISAEVSHCGRYLIVFLQKGCRDNLVYFCDFDQINYKIEGKLPLTQIVTRLEADYDYVTNTGPEFIFRTNKNASNYRLVKINLENYGEDNWTTLVKEHSLDVLDWAAAVNKDKLMICYMRHVKDVLEYHDLSDGRLIYTFPLEVGRVVELKGKKKYSEIFFKVNSFLTPGIVYRTDLNDPNFEMQIHKEVKPEGFDRENYETHQIFYSGLDGTKIPMFLVHKKNLVKNGQNPCFMYGYGGFNISLKPYFSVIMTVFIKHLDGIFAVPNIRGGGEYGEKWHNQGRFQNKQNTFNDFQAAAEYLIANKYTNTKLLTIKGDSNGGLLVSACAIQRPELFGAVICGVGVMDMLRFQKFTIGSAWVSDYGSSDIKEQFEYLIKYSPLHNIKLPPEGTQYPAMLLKTADHDDRVVPLHSLKFIATLQNVIKDYEKQTNPLLIRVYVKAGHGAGKPTYKMIEEATEMLCFMIQSLNLSFKP